jgi:hypothetical protein
VVGVVLAVIWRGFLRGGTEVGYSFHLYQLFRMFYILAPICAILIVMATGQLWNVRRTSRAWELTRPSWTVAARDMLANFIVGYLSFAILIVGLGCYAVVRMGGDPSSVVNVLVVVAVGPLLGGYVTLGLGYLAGFVSGQPAFRIGVVVVMACLDAVSQVPSRYLTLSGTSRIVEPAYWGLAGVDPPAGAMVSPTPGFALGRLGLALVVTAWLVYAARRQTRREAFDRTALVGV